MSDTDVQRMMSQAISPVIADKLANLKVLKDICVNNSFFSWRFVTYQLKTAVPLELTFRYANNPAEAVMMRQ